MLKMPYNFQNSAATADSIVDDTISNNSKRFADKNNRENSLNHNWAAVCRENGGSVRNTIQESSFHHQRNRQGIEPPPANDNGALCNNKCSGTGYLNGQFQRLRIITRYQENDFAAIAPQEDWGFRQEVTHEERDENNNGSRYQYGHGHAEGSSGSDESKREHWGAARKCGDNAPSSQKQSSEAFVDNAGNADDAGKKDEGSVCIDGGERGDEGGDCGKEREIGEEQGRNYSCGEPCDYGHCQDGVLEHRENSSNHDDPKEEDEGEEEEEDELDEEEDDNNENEEDEEYAGSEEASQTTEVESDVPKVTKSKSYWRKQRRLRLKELLVAQRQKMEADGMSPEEIQQERLEMSRKKKSLKPKIEIDYDKYLPSSILMHVKRDLVSILMEYGQTREVKVAFEEMDRTGPHHASRFFTSALVDGETFPVGCGSSKKNAKKAAAAFALKIMYERGKQNLRMVNESAFRKIGALNPKDPESRAHKVLLASRHALEVCQETQFINYSKEKIVATFVLELHGKMKVVALGTGNRCILYPNLTQDGNKIIHAHAEVVARRAFIRYLYKQLLLFNRGRNHPIFTKSESGKLKLRDKIQVHLYISRPPCGDAAAFPTIGNHPNKMRAVRKQGQLRTIIDDGEGAIPTEFHVPPGPNGKERLRIMTCSDKICRWNALGMQGALLTHFIDPIYINTLVIGSHTGDQRGHLPRAISGRIKCGRLHEVIQRPYRINSPEIQYPHDDMCDIYTINKSKQYFITWSYGDEDTEVIDAITGVTNMEPLDQPEISRVCKRSLHGLFLELCAKFGRTDLIDMDYCTAKRCATTFQRMKSFVGQHMAVMGFGHWYSLQETYGTDNFSSNNNDCPTSC